jgi:hypothetical protein
MRVVYVGNFGPEHSTENHVRRALTNNGHDVWTAQESGLDWSKIPEYAADTKADLFMWTRTAGFDPANLTTQHDTIEALRRQGIPTVGYHLDRWWGLNREPDIHRSPFFRVDLLVTADGGHDQEWLEAGVNHQWMPPAVSQGEAGRGTYNPAYACDVAFVGNLIGYGHPEWAPYRQQLFNHLNSRYRGRFRVFPGQGRPAIRGKALQDLYASVKVVVGDSCLAGGAERYWSDRVPETLGRGGNLIHPWVYGLTEAHPFLATWPLGDWDALDELIERRLAESDENREEFIGLNWNHTLTEHTYEKRMADLITRVKEMT